MIHVKNYYQHNLTYLLLFTAWSPSRLVHTHATARLTSTPAYYCWRCLGAHLIISSTRKIISAASAALTRTCNFDL